ATLLHHYIGDIGHGQEVLPRYFGAGLTDFEYKKKGRQWRCLVCCVTELKRCTHHVVEVFNVFSCMALRLIGLSCHDVFDQLSVFDNMLVQRGEERKSV